MRGPSTLAGAIALLQREDLAVKLLAGGQSLGPMLNLRLAQPDLLVDITAVPDLLRVETEDDGLLIGACVTHADIEDGRVPDPTQGALPAVARAIAYRAVRNRGTIGGSLVHADPAADWISALAALGADVIMRGPAGQRRLPVEQFMAGVFEAALAPDELLEAIRRAAALAPPALGVLQVLPQGRRIRAGHWLVLYDPERAVCRVVIGATESTPIVVPDATPLFGGRPEDGLALTFDSSHAARLLDNKGIRDPFERQIHLVALERAVHLASRP